MRLVLPSGSQVNLNPFVYSILFIFSFQVFYATKDLPVLYYSTRLIIPVLSFLLSLIWVTSLTLNKRSIPYTGFLIFIFVFLIVVNALVAYYNFNQPLYYGLTAQFKLLSVFYFFLVLYILILTNATKQDLTTTIIFLGIFSFVVYYLMNFLVDPKMYYKPGSELVYYDYNKGYRYKFRTIFGIISLFFFYRLFLKTLYFRYILFVLFFLSYIVFFSKGRFELMSIIVALMIASGEGKSLSTKVLWGVVFLLAIVLILNFVPHFATILEADDTSGSIRIVSLSTVYNSFERFPENLLLGFGYINPLFKTDYNSVFGESFFVADIGWFGLLFEFGLAGVLIFMWYYYILYKESSLRSTGTFLQLSIKDFVVKTIITSVLTPSIPYLWGIYATLLAILVYLNYFIIPVSSEEQYSND